MLQRIWLIELPLVSNSLFGEFERSCLTTEFSITKEKDKQSEVRDSLKYKMKQYYSDLRVGDVISLYHGDTLEKRLTVSYFDHKRITLLEYDEGKRIFLLDGKLSSITPRFYIFNHGTRGKNRAHVGIQIGDNFRYEIMRCSANQRKIA